MRQKPCHFNGIEDSPRKSKYLVHFFETPTSGLREKVINNRHHCSVAACKYNEVCLSHTVECDGSDSGDQDTNSPGTAYAEAVNGGSQVKGRNLRSVEVWYRAEADDVAEVEQEDKEHGTTHS